jgi:transcriptional regulator with XRE-family HTH domain
MQFVWFALQITEAVRAKIGGFRPSGVLGDEMQEFERDKLRQELDVVLLPFRLAKKRKGGGKKGWVQSIRQATGIPVDELGRRMGVCRWEIHRLEESEKNSRIMLATLSRAAHGLGCELVYALVPKEKTLEEMANEQKEVREDLRLARERKREQEKKPWLESIGFREKFLSAMRTVLRNEGYRERPTRTQRGAAKQLAEYEEAEKLARHARLMGPLMSETKKDRE